MMDLDRRGFLAALAAAGVSQLALAQPAFAAGGPMGFPEASSNPLRWPFVMGLLVVNDPGAREAEIEGLRAKTSYRRKLAYASSDRKKEAFAEALIAWFAASKEVGFAALVVDDPDAKWPDKNDARDVILTGLCRQLVATAGSPTGLVLNVPANRQAPRDRVMQAIVPATGDAPPDMPNLDQTARFLTGSLYGEVTHVQQALRKKLIGALASALKVPVLAGAKVPGKFTAAPVTLT